MLCRLTDPCIILTTPVLPQSPNKGHMTQTKDWRGEFWGVGDINFLHYRAHPLSEGCFLGRVMHGCAPAQFKQSQASLSPALLFIFLLLLQEFSSLFGYCGEVSFHLLLPRLLDLPIAMQLLLLLPLLLLVLRLLLITIVAIIILLLMLN